MALLQILWNDILPLLIFIAAGWFLDSRFKLDLNTYTKLTTRAVLPVFIFYSIYCYVPDTSTTLLIPAALALFLLNGAASFFSAKLLGFSGNNARIFQALSSFSNAGQIGIALILMIFSHAPYLSGKETPFLDEARSTMIILLILMNIAVNIFGASLLGVKEFSFSRFVKFMMSMPALYAVIAALLVKVTGVSLESTFLWPVLAHFTGAFIILVTITTGAQLHRSPAGRPGLLTLTSLFHRLILSPVFAFLIIKTAGIFTPVTAQVFFIFSAIPASVTLVLFAADYDVSPGLVARSVLYSSAAGIFTMACIIQLAQYLFPAGV